MTDPPLYDVVNFVTYLLGIGYLLLVQCAPFLQITNRTWSITNRCCRIVDRLSRGRELEAGIERNWLKDLAEGNGRVAGGTGQHDLRAQYREERVSPLCIDLEKNPATLKSDFWFWAVA